MKQSQPQLDEYRLMREFANGKRSAFTSIYNEYRLRVYQYAEGFLPTPADAEDITADTFAKLWQHRDEFSDLDHVRAFLFTAVKNACINFHRHSLVKNEKHAEIFRRLTTEQQTGFHLQEVRTELMKLIYAEVEKLPGKMKQVFLLSYQHGLKPSEIAARLNLSVQTVKNQKVTAIHLLKTALGSNSFLLALVLCLEYQHSWSA